VNAKVSPKPTPADADTLQRDRSAAKQLFFGDIFEENLFPYPKMRERDLEMLAPTMFLAHLFAGSWRWVALAVRTHHSARWLSTSIFLLRSCSRRPQLALIGGAEARYCEAGHWRTDCRVLPD
jgi:hypothetical protein